jgi:hypothetical protein
MYNAQRIIKWSQEVQPCSPSPLPSPLVTPSPQYKAPRPDFPLSRQKPAMPALCTPQQSPSRAPGTTSPVSVLSNDPSSGRAGEALVRSLTPASPSFTSPPSSPPPHRAHVHASPAQLASQAGNVFEGFARRLRQAWGHESSLPRPVKALDARDAYKLKHDKPAEVRVHKHTCIRAATPSPPPRPTPSELSPVTSPLDLPPLALARTVYRPTTVQLPISSITKPRFNSTRSVRPPTQIVSFPNDDDEDSEDELDAMMHFPIIKRPTAAETAEELELENRKAKRASLTDEVRPFAPVALQIPSGVINEKGSEPRGVWIAGRKQAELSEYCPVYYDLSDSRRREAHRPVCPLLQDGDTRQ